MTEVRPLFIPIVLGTPRKGRFSEHVANLVLGELKGRRGVETGLIDVRSLKLAIDDAGENIKDPEFSETVMRADALILVAPEYNHGYPGLLKHVLDTNLKEYIHKAVGICGVSAGGFGGTRVIESLLPVMRELGLVTIFWDGNFSGVQKLFDSSGGLLDQAYVKRMDKFLTELIWMARVLRAGREAEAIAPEVAPMTCPACGAQMNPHAQKLVPSVAETEQTFDVLTCPACRQVEMRGAQ